MKRRSFLKNSAFISGSMMAPSFLKNFSASLENSRSGKILVVIQLSGGNDGLNTIVPYRNDLYYNLRPSIGLKKDKLLDLNGDLAMHISLKALNEVYDNGEMAIINNVGYPNPDRSHFRSMDIWHTASDSNTYLQSGWLGRYLDSNCNNCQNNRHVLEIDTGLSLAVKGKQRSGFAIQNAKQLKRTSSNHMLKGIASSKHHHHHDQVAYLYKTLIETQQSADYLHDKSKNHKSKFSYPTNKLGNKLKTVAELITAESDTKIYYVSLSGFDTHAMQMGTHTRLLSQYAEALSVFIKDLKANDLFKDTLIMTFSEFGRRAKQNASKGTDHGTANNLFLMSGSLKKAGILNEGPDLSKLVDDDLVFKVDFRSIYADILEAWLDQNHVSILGNKFERLNFI